MKFLEYKANFFSQYSTHFDLANRSNQTYNIYV